MSVGKKKTGLVLEGGAMRGLFSAGVMDVFMENGITFDGCVGISAGAVFGLNYKSNQIGRSIRYNLKYCKDPRYCSFKSLLTTGDLYGVDFCYRVLPYELDIFDSKAFKKNPMKFYIGATDVNTGKCLFHLCSDGGVFDMTWMRASASMPLVSRIVEVEGFKLLDGGIADSVPYRFMEKEGYNRNVIILTQPKGYRKSKNKLLPVMKVVLRKYPKLVHAMEIRQDMYNKQMRGIDRREKEGTSFVIRPPKDLGIGRTENDPAKLKEVYDIGRAEGLRVLDSLKEFLAKE